ncbi:Uncharacterised protein [Legionella pneumophila]|nr:Uncharacterised protein [Legionella pneumophila]CZG17181.1 Uncharacterised protein [Legionella pneumophila]CZG52150.1 Uncharacterised protein [Legionella pneumophila]
MTLPKKLWSSASLDSSSAGYKDIILVEGYFRFFIRGILWRRH